MIPARANPETIPSSTPKTRVQAGVRLGLSLLFVTAGVFHFINPKIFLSIVPPWLPFPLEAVYLSGVAEIAGGLMLLWPKTRNWGVITLMLLLVAVFPANIHMLLEAEKYSFPAWILWARLPLQPALIALLWWSSWEAGK
jgi:uncharacterized membrane protein